MIKQDFSDGEESESQGSGSESDEPKEIIELPPLEKSRRNITVDEPNSSKLPERKVKRKLILNEKFAKRLKQLREKRRKDKNKEGNHNFPSIIASVSTNRRFRSSEVKEINSALI